MNSLNRHDYEPWGKPEEAAKWRAKSVDALIDAVVRAELDEAGTLRLCIESPELVTLAVLAAGRRNADQDRRCSEQDD